jgi:hypothetical protein
MIKFIDPDIRPLASEVESLFFTHAYEFLNEVMSPPTLQPTPVGGSCSFRAFKEYVEVAKSACVQSGVAEYADGRGGSRKRSLDP